MRTPLRPLKFAIRGMRALALAVLICGMANSNPAWGTQTIILGQADTFPVDQPVAKVQLVDTSGATPVTLGPVATNAEPFLLDTGLAYTFFGAAAVQDMTANGYATTGLYDHTDLAATTTFNVSNPYRLDLYNVATPAQPISSQRVLSSPTVNVYDDGAVKGILGMNAMTEHVVALGMQDWSTPGSTLNLSTQYLVASPTNAHQYAIDLTMVNMPTSGQHGTDPLPSVAAVPFAPVQLGSNGREVNSSFLVSTGQPQTVFSNTLLQSLGVDLNNSIGTEPLSGITGVYNAKLYKVDYLSLMTHDGQRIMLTNLVVPGANLDASTAGILGMDVLTSGWGNKLLGGAQNGNFTEADFNFLGSTTSNTAQLLLTLTPSKDAIVDHDWQNPLNRLDVNHDGLVSALDALIIINEINANGAHTLGSFAGTSRFFWDTSGDNFVSALDALQVINYLNSNPLSSGGLVLLGLNVPEPGTWALLALGHCGVFWFGMRRKQNCNCKAI
jgi:hypothetical protein